VWGLQLSSSAVRYNQAGAGAGLFLLGPGKGGGAITTWFATAVDLKGNAAQAEGGAVAMANGSSLQALRLWLGYNSATYGGGLFLGNDTRAAVTGLDAHNNTALYSGGAAYLTSFARLALGNASASLNLARWAKGSTLFVEKRADLTVTNLTLTGERGSRSAIAGAGTMRVRRSVFSNVSAPLAYVLDYWGTRLTIDYSAFRGCQTATGAVVNAPKDNPILVGR
jgi:hypothetical protein